MDATPPREPGGVVRLRARCTHCGREREFAFRCGHVTGGNGLESETINPTDEPSAIIDVAQWLSLFYLLIETAASEGSRAACRRAGYRAALCLDEALKFYREGGEPPASAFFSEATASVFREHPEKYSRCRLREMQGKLPSRPTMARRLARDEGAARRRWWQFWRR